MNPRRRCCLTGLGAAAALILGGCFPVRGEFDAFESGFASPTWKLWWMGKDFEDTVEVHAADDRRFGFEPSMAGAGGDALRVTIKQNQHEGTHHLQYNFEDQLYIEPEQATASYLMRFGSTFSPVEPGKLPGFAGTYRRAGWGPRVSDGFNGWSARSMFYPSPKGAPIRVASLTYLADMAAKGGNSTFFDWHTRGIPRFERDRWYHIIQHVRLNSVEGKVGKPDGVLQVWVDGKVAVDERAVVFRHTEKLKIERMWFNIHYGGGPAPEDYHVFLDEVVVHAGEPGRYEPTIGPTISVRASPVEPAVKPAQRVPMQK
jgi:hypothetical protein